MDDAGAAGACIVLELAYGLQEGLAFDVADRAADLDDGDFRLVFRVVAVETAFDFVGNMGDYLYGSAAKVSAAFLLQDRPVDLARGDVGIPGEAFVDKTLIVA